MDEDATKKAVSYYREYFSDRGILKINYMTALKIFSDCSKTGIKPLYLQLQNRKFTPENSGTF
ncbi:hypothetical protein K7I13_07640 [Brucepastera parasyntrophica]|uniref:hypothetical protein n=1 Tax=Brucepastera parasyntrophica TaxID=2880008 RepID=UPI00210DFFC1|nr:hypothetical protein [Brucepastera parasyntrophica]ULQ58454.1 hypothetical protein K7I13_07640 [Brucepastera parasyntrophica]